MFKLTASRSTRWAIRTKPSAMFYSNNSVDEFLSEQAERMCFETKEKSPTRASGVLSHEKLAKLLPETIAVSQPSSKSAWKKPLSSVSEPHAMKKDKSSPWRQERFAQSIQEFVQQLLLTETDTCHPPFFLEIVKVDVAPDLRRARVHWSLNRFDETLSSRCKETKMMKTYLESITKWVRFKTTRHMQSKYSAVIEFKHAKTV